MMEHLDILLIDDNPEDRSLASHYLNKEFDVDIKHVIDKSELEGALEDGDFDIVITDYRLRWADGLDVLDEIKSRYPDVGVIMFTGTGNEEVAIKGMRKGLDDYIIKSPGHFELIPPSIRSILEKKEQKKRRERTEKREELLHSLLRHDVRNKIQIIISSLELIDQYDVPEEIEHHLSKIDRASKESIQLIQKIRSLMEIDDEEVGPVDLKDIIENAIEGKRPLMKENDIDIDMKIDNHDIKVRGSSLLKELFENVIENSLNHSNCSEIVVKVKEKQNEAVCIIQDDGKGIIPDELKEKVFERGFSQGGNSGTGIGMFLVQQIAEAYGGSVEVMDSEMGGARFDVHLEKV